MITFGLETSWCDVHLIFIYSNLSVARIDILAAILQERPIGRRFGGTTPEPTAVFDFYSISRVITPDEPTAILYS